MTIVYMLFLLVAGVDLKYLQYTLPESSKIELSRVNIFQDLNREVSSENKLFPGSQKNSNHNNTTTSKKFPSEVSQHLKADKQIKENMAQSPSIDSATKTEVKHGKSKREIFTKTGSSNMNSIESGNFLEVLNSIDQEKTMTLNFPLEMNELHPNNPRRMNPILRAQLNTADYVDETGSYFDPISDGIRSHYRDKFWKDYHITHIGGGSQLKCPLPCYVRDLSGRCFLDLKCYFENSRSRH